MFPIPFLYRFRFLCRYAREFGELAPSYSLPDMNELAKDSGKNKSPFDFRIGWNENGFLLLLSVSGKKQLPCRSVQPDESDGIQICLDTRDIKDIHRASRFCHRLLFTPSGSGTNMSQPTAVWLPIARAKEHPYTIDLQQIKMKSEVSGSGYRLSVFLPGKVLTGFDPQEYPNIGFHFTIKDKEHGNFYFLAAPPLPHDHDPSIWGSLVLGK
ncbi:MAG: hypothetical protein LBH00_01830 [Planctomycetaceae bacterium]|nr:hypothetical protein [Planctomycetaceae bacterium]